MGGNVFKFQYDVVRLSAESYFETVRQVKTLLDGIQSGLAYHDVQAMYEKTDFGDMDLVVNTNDPEQIQLHSEYLSNLGYPVSRNGDVLSFLYHNFQIDLIFIPTESFDYACNYFAWNDLGNIVGRLSKKLGFKHGHSGLWYIQRDYDVVVKEYLLSADYLTILGILGLDVEHFKKGFNNSLEMFEWAGKSPYFDPEIFKFENLNHINRVRDRKRKVYNELVKWSTEVWKPDPNVTYLTPPAKEDRRAFVLNLYPEIAQPIFALELELSLQREASKKFNGKIVMELIPELSGKSLGAFLTYFKSKQVHFTAYALNATTEDIHMDILTLYQEYIKDV